MVYLLLFSIFLEIKKIYGTHLVFLNLAYVQLCNVCMQNCLYVILSMCAKFHVLTAFWVLRIHYTTGYIVVSPPPPS